MNISFILLIIEGTIVFFGIIALLYFRWKKEKNKTTEFKILLDNISHQADERKAHLIKSLMEAYATDNEVATESSEYMMEAEKQFLQQFIKQQMEQSSVTDFYQNLCELLDQYLYFISNTNADQIKTDDTENPAIEDQNFSDKNEIKTETNIPKADEQKNETTSSDKDSLKQIEASENVQTEHQ